MYKLHLILKYLLKRRIAWVSLFAVMLCTTMVLVVISVMGGWLNKFKSSFRGLSGDLVIQSETLSGFPWYNEVIDAIKKDPQCQVQDAVPSIETAALYDYGRGPKTVRALGINIEEMSKVSSFDESLFRQHTMIEDELKKPDVTPEQRTRLEGLLKRKPTFDFLDVLDVPMEALPSGLAYAPPPDAGLPLPPGTIAMPDTFPAGLIGRLRYDVGNKLLKYRGFMPAAWNALLKKLSPDPAYQHAVDALAAKGDSIPFIYKRVQGRSDGIIVGVGVIGVGRDADGKWNRQPMEIENNRPTTLTLLDLSGKKVERGNTLNFFIVDDSHLGVWQYDSLCVYVPLDVLQTALGLSEQTVEPENGGKAYIQPARVTHIHIKAKAGIDVNDEDKLAELQSHIAAVMTDVLAKQRKLHPDYQDISGDPTVERWQDVNRTYISAVEHEKILMVILFGIMCVVAIFLIFCIFYMIVVEKTRDIGIVKSVGATSTGVAAIFLGYGLVIGIIGSAMGLLLSYGIIHNINELHGWLIRRFHVRIWDPQVYIFDNIPNQMSWQDISWIVPTAILASVLAALIPAIRAARLNPVDALRWE